MALTDSEHKLFFAVIAGDVQRVAEAIEAGADVNARNSNGMTPLLVACLGPSIKLGIVQLLIDNKADVNAKDHDDNTPLMLACYCTNPSSELYEIIQLLIDNKADVNAANNKGWTPLMFACGNTNNKKPEGIIRLLLDKGADVNATTTKGTTAWAFALCNPNIKQETIQLLLSNEIINKILTQAKQLKQKLADAEQNNAKYKAQLDLNKFQDKKRKQKELRNVLLKKYRLK